MQNKMIFCAIASLAVSAAVAKSTEYECDDGRSESGYRIRVIEMSRDLQEVIVLKKSNGSATLVEAKKVRRIGGSASAPQFESGKAGKRIGFKKSEMDSQGNWTGTFTIPSKRGSLTVQAKCGQVETLTM